MSKRFEETLHKLVDHSYIVYGQRAKGKLHNINSQQGNAN